MPTLLHRSFRVSAQTCVAGNVGGVLKGSQVCIAVLETASERHSEEEYHNARGISPRPQYRCWGCILPRRYPQVRFIVRPSRAIPLRCSHVATSAANVATYRTLSKTSSHPDTPPSSSSQTKPRGNDVSPPPRTSGGPASPPFKNYINFLSKTNDDWKADEDEMMGYDDDDGDDFGLPSLSSMKRRARRRETQDGGNPNNLSPALGSSWNDPSSRRYSNSADIAIERPAPSYPMPKKSEGKILRPQYKEILRGVSASFISEAGKFGRLTSS